LASIKTISGLFPLIGASANCSSYQNPRRHLAESGNLIGLFKTGTGAKKALAVKVKVVTCFIDKILFKE